jgi:hypothetical protein
VLELNALYVYLALDLVALSAPGRAASESGTHVEYLRDALKMLVRFFYLVCDLLSPKYALYTRFVVQLLEG